MTVSVEILIPDGSNLIPKFRTVSWWRYCGNGIRSYGGADKSSARPRWKQGRKQVRDTRDFNIETRAVFKFFFFFLQSKALREINAFLTETLACFLPGRAEEFMCVRSTLLLNVQPTRPNTTQHPNLHQHCCEKLKPNLCYMGLHSNERWWVKEIEENSKKNSHSFFTTCFRKERFSREENCVLLSYYAASSGNLFPTFQDNLSVQSLRFKNPGFWILEPWGWDW